MGAQSRPRKRIESRSSDYFAAEESILVVTVANPQRTNIFFLAAALASLVAARKLLSQDILAAAGVGVIVGLVGAGVAAVLAALTVRGRAKSIPPLTHYLVLTDARLVTIRCWPWGTPGTLAASFTPADIAAFHDAKALLTSRLGVEFADGSSYLGDVHGTLGSDFAAAGNAWLGQRNGG